MSGVTFDRMTRVAWMGGPGRDIYGTWTRELLEACDNRAFWQLHQQFTNDRAGGNSQPTIDDIIEPIASGPDRLTEMVDDYHGISAHILEPQANEIIQYTGAGDFLKNGRTEEETVKVHAHDSLAFAIGLSAGLAHDVVLDIVPREAAKNLNQESETTLLLQRLVLTEQFLQNDSLAECLEPLSITGFDVIGALASYRIDQRKGGVPGRQERAARFGITTEDDELAPTVLQYNQGTDTFSIREGVIPYIRQALIRQNKHGLSVFARKAAGKSAEVTGAFSRGCPVAGTGTMALTAAFTAKAIRNAGNI